MDNLEVIMEEVLCKMYTRVINSEEVLLKKLNGLTLKEFKTLDVIAMTTKTRTNTASNISKILNVTPGTLTTNIDRLCQKGYVEKIKDESDKRYIKIVLTTLGTNLRRRREDGHMKLIRDALSKLNTSEKVALMNAVNKLDV